MFGSNLAGIHGAGAAHYAHRYFGARYGDGEGRTGNSYALPTKDRQIKTRPLEAIQASVTKFLEYATLHPELGFEVTRVGCGLAGYKDEDIAPMFKGAPVNCELPEGWRDFADRVAG